MKGDIFKELDYVTMVEKECRKYGLKCEYRFGEMHIRSMGGKWKFIPNEDNRVKLQHMDSISSYRGINTKDRYHVQFCRTMGPKDVVRYIYEHDKAKYSGRYVRFTYTKDGAFVNA